MFDTICEVVNDYTFDTCVSVKQFLSPTKGHCESLATLTLDDIDGIEGLDEILANLK